MVLQNSIQDPSSQVEPLILFYLTQNNKKKASETDEETVSNRIIYVYIP
jgi:hypothetical protein